MPRLTISDDTGLFPRCASRVAGASGAALLTYLLFACGGNTEGGSGGTGSMGGASGQVFSSGLPGDRTLGSLSAQELQQLCSAFNGFALERYSGIAAPALCKFSAVLGAGFTMPQTDAELRQQCQQSYDMCIQTAPSLSGTSIPVQVCPSYPNCAATVAEYETCLGDEQLAFEDMLNKLPECQSLVLSQLPVQLSPPATPASCVAFYRKCPGG